jgi:hypothetical protein
MSILTVSYNRSPINDMTEVAQARLNKSFVLDTHFEVFWMQYLDRGKGRAAG